MFNIDPILKCQLYPGTVFEAPLRGENVEWKIIGRTDKGVTAVPLVASFMTDGKFYTFNQFGYLMSVKKLIRFKEVVLGE